MKHHYEYDKSGVKDLSENSNSLNSSIKRVQIQSNWRLATQVTMHGYNTVQEVVHEIV